MAPEEIQLPEEPVEPTPEAAPPVEAPQEIAEPEIEVLPYRSIKGEERQLRAEALKMLAEDFGYENPAAIINQLRNGEETQQMMREMRRNALRYQEPDQYQPAPPPYQAPPQYQPRRDAYGQVPPQRYQAPVDPEDPIAVLRAMDERTRQLDERTARFDAYLEAQARKEQEQMQERYFTLKEEAEDAYDSFYNKLRKENVPDHKIPSADYLLGHAERMGWFRPGGPDVSTMLDRTYRILFSDDIAERAAQNAVTKLRSPKATVTVPSPRPPAPPAPTNPADALQGMTTRDALSLLPRFNQ